MKNVRRLGRHLRMDSGLVVDARMMTLSLIITKIRNKRICLSSFTCKKKSSISNKEKKKKSGLRVWESGFKESVLRSDLWDCD